MAELVGLISAGLGLLPLATQLATEAGKLRKANRLLPTLPDEVRSLIEDLDYLRWTITNISNAMPPEVVQSERVKYCEKRLRAVVQNVRDFSQTMLPDPNTRGIKLSAFRLRFRHCKDALKDIKQDIIEVKIDLLLL